MTCLTPRGEALSKFRFTKRTWVHDLPAKVHTGDVVLFSSKHNASSITKFFTSSGWDHIGIVVKPSATQVFLLEWGGGLFVCPFVDRLVEYYEGDGRLITLRQLQLGAHRSRIEDQMEEFVDMLLRSGLGSNGAVPINQALKAVQKQHGAEKGGDAVVDDLENLFCSKTVAVCYKSVGLIAPNRDASLFLPKHFSARHDDFSDLQGGASLGPEIDISFEPKQIRQFTLALLALADGTDNKKKRAAVVIGNSARRWLARTELARRRKQEGGKGNEHTRAERRTLLRDMSRFGEDNPRPKLASAYSAYEVAE